MMLYKIVKQSEMKNYRSYSRVILMGLLLAFVPQLTDAQEKKTTEKENPQLRTKESSRKQQMEEYKVKIAEIENNPDFTQNEKDSLILIERKELKTLIKGKKKGRKYGMRGKKSIYNKEQKQIREASRLEMDKALSQIENNSKLSDDEKKQAKMVLKEAHKRERKEAMTRRGGKVNSAGGKKGKKDGVDEDLRPEAKRQNATPRKGRNMLTGINTAELSEKEIKRLEKRLRKLSRKLDKQKKKGKISEELYNERKTEIEQLQAKIK